MPKPPEIVEVVAVGCFNPEGKLLLGLRSDVQKWTAPAGHLEPGEKPVRGALRELYEEANITPKSLVYLGNGMVKLSEDRSVNVHCFRAEIEGDQVPTGDNDPDKECAVWKWVDVSLNSLPPEYDRAIYNPNDVLLKLLGLQRGVVHPELPKTQPGDIKVIVEQKGMSDAPIEGSADYVFTQLAARFPGVANEAQQGDVEGLALAINETGAAFIAYGEELNAPRHRLKHTVYDYNEVEDPWTEAKEARPDRIGSNKTWVD